MKKLLLFSALGVLAFQANNGLYAAKKQVSKTKSVSTEQTTDLIEAVKVGNKKMFNKCLKYDDINFVDKNGKTAMDYAAERNNRKMIFELSKRHALVSRNANQLIVQETIKRKVNAYKGAGISWIFLGPAPIVGGVTFLMRRSSWKEVLAFYSDDNASLV